MRTTRPTHFCSRSAMLLRCVPTVHSRHTPTNHFRSSSAAVLRLLLAVNCTIAVAQTPQSLRRRPVRVEAPSFQPQQFEGIFFADPAAQLQGSPPTAGLVSPLQSRPDSAAGLAHGSASDRSEADPHGWHQLISATSLEDLVKASKLRLDNCDHYACF